ncbi:FAD linked oxidase domain protein [Desulfatibacillum aliphaticivorans]|uniref:FAD linked oxidase domain protein n=1 Tax=Desulfatibacillum aliphaticivorans TaxID=218208 RepID=B8FA26_DESAL|nr:FAD-binding oxidoreductase [Desulfatibacillum aliphaticivorans]ACL03122.1 FAD linked oxidase domain protein [Desulfatibacillum aliphaticivorans]
MTACEYPSWGRLDFGPQQGERIPAEDFSFDALASSPPYLPYGNGRSYGDSCLNAQGALLDCRRLNKILAFDEKTGVIKCQAGVLLSQILDHALPKGWILPVTPGTRFVTIGGCIANDVHGKNHHQAGTFGRHVRCFELKRSNGETLLCSPEENPDLFRAAIGGLGLTGLISWAEIQLSPCQNPVIHQETVKFSGLNGFFDLSKESDANHEFTVAWVDCLARGRSLGRGHFIRGNYSPARPNKSAGSRSINMPFDPPFSLVNKLSLKAFNSLYYNRQTAPKKSCIVPCQTFFYPLDAIENWNRLYGKNGFYQYQCVIPPESSREGVREILDRIAAAGIGSFLAVLKRFGNITSPGLLSFPRPGVTLALDFPNQGPKTLALFNILDQVAAQAGGALYPAKDARMSPKMFRLSFPALEKFLPHVDPAFSSCFWRRTNERRQE